MNESTLTALVSLLSAVVVLGTALVGYLKVLKPMRQLAHDNGDALGGLDRSMRGYEERLSLIRETAEAAQAAAESFKLHAESCDLDRAKLARDIEALKARNDDLQDKLLGGR